MRQGVSRLLGNLRTGSMADELPKFRSGLLDLPLPCIDPCQGHLWLAFLVGIELFCLLKVIDGLVVPL